MSNTKKAVSPVDEFIKVFYEMSARYGRSELWYDYIDMCYIQMCCIGVPGVVVVGNSLFPDAERSPTDFWFTPKYFLLDDNALKNTYTEKE